MDPARPDSENATPVPRRVATELAKRRVFAFLLVFLLVSSGDSVNRALDDPTRVVAVVVSGLVLAALAVIVVGWRRRSLGDLRTQHNVIAVLALMVLGSLAVSFHFPVLVFAALLLANRLIP